MRDLQDDMNSKRSWTQDEIDALKSKHRRTHFTHFPGSPRKLRSAAGWPYVWVEVSAGRWRLVRKVVNDGKETSTKGT